MDPNRPEEIEELETGDDAKVLFKIKSRYSSVQVMQHDKSDDTNFSSWGREAFDCFGDVNGCYRSLRIGTKWCTAGSSGPRFSAPKARMTVVKQTTSILNWGLHSLL